MYYFERSFLVAVSNHERVGRALETLKAGLRPFVERELRAIYRKAWTTQISGIVAGSKRQ